MIDVDVFFLYVLLFMTDLLCFKYTIEAFIIEVLTACLFWFLFLLLFEEVLPYLFLHERGQHAFLDIYEYMSLESNRKPKMTSSRK